MSTRDFMMMFIGFAGLFVIGGMFWLASWLDRKEAERWREPDWNAPPTRTRIPCRDIIGMGESPRSFTPLAEGLVNKGGRNSSVSRIVDRPPPPQPSTIRKAGMPHFGMGEAPRERA